MFVDRCLHSVSIYEVDFWIKKNKLSNIYSLTSKHMTLTIQCFPEWIKKDQSAITIMNHGFNYLTYAFL